MKAFVNKELSHTSRYGVTAPPQRRIQSAKGRIETAETEKRKVSSSSRKTKKLYRRPLSAISQREQKPLETSGERRQLSSLLPGCSSDESFKEKTAEEPGRKIDNGNFRFEIHGSSVVKPSFTSCHKVNENSGITPSNYSKPRTHEGEKVIVQDEPDKIQRLGKISNNTSSFVVDPEKNDSGCFLTEAADSDCDLTGCDNTHSETVGQVSAGSGELYKQNFKSSSHLPADRKNRNSQRNSRFSVKPCFLTIQLEDDADSSDTLHLRNAVRDHFPYKLQSCNSSESSLVPVVSDLAENPCNEESITHLGRKLPETLSSLRDFVCTGEDEDLVKQLTGISPQNCLVFLPDIDSYDINRVEEVPSVQHVDDDLPYKSKVTSPQPWAPKKYSHSYKPMPVYKWECKHVKGHRRIETSTCTSTISKRTAELVRKEIQELEDLLKGIGSIDSDCLIVQYQAEINKLQSTVQDTLNKFSRSFCRHASPEEPDHFGLRKFYKHHDMIIKQIREQHAVCIQELAKLEEEANLSHAERHFSKQDTAVVVGVNGPNGTNNTEL